MSIDDLSDDEEDVLRALRRMAQIEACYRVPPHLVPAARHLQRKGLVREVAWQGPCPPACGTALELLPTGAILAARLPRADGDGAFRTLGEIRGRWQDYLGRPLLITYHPSYLLRKGAESKESERKAKRAAWEDFLKVMEKAGLPISEKQQGYFL